jgi:FAD/FMN-containing dehydrogenase
MRISSPLKGGIPLEMLVMDKLFEVNPMMQYIIAEGAASVYAIHHALRQHGLRLPFRHLRSRGRDRRDD